ncbi:MAG: NAD(P)H-dependent oxidoreductase [Algiphilus sp.]|uniref:FMN-dependent NADH-azoreductase n=1 Tax=Algiphilus sp. TaxID=1872431 RepID=UPI0032EE75D5
MTTILQVEASARVERSLSRALAHTFRAAWHEREPTARFIQRDVGRQPPPFVMASWIEAAFTDASERSAEQSAALATSDALIDELEQADIVVIATPMYNYGMPATLKAWFDQVIRVNKTFTFDLARGDFPLQPRLHGKTLVGLCAHGEFGFGAGGTRSKMNHLQPHLATCAHYLGTTRHHFVSVEYQEFGDERHHSSIKSAHEQVRQLVAQLTDAHHAAATT